MVSTFLKIFISILLVGACASGFFTFYQGYIASYGITVDPGYQEYYTNMSNSSQDVSDIATDMKTDLEGFSTKNVFIQGFMITYDTLRLIINIPISIFTTITSLIGISILAFGLPSWVTVLITSAIIMTIIAIILAILTNRSEF